MSNNLQRKKKIFQGQRENTQEVSFSLNESQQKGVEGKKIYLNMFFFNARSWISVIFAQKSSKKLRLMVGGYRRCLFIHK